jgi:phage/plasmid-like protein (TIGR03299 family)
VRTHPTIILPSMNSTSTSNETIHGPTTSLPPRRSNPWRMHGTTLMAEATTNPVAAMRAAGLDFAVERVELRTADTFDPVPDVRAIRRTDTHAILSVVGREYIPLQNNSMFDVIRDLGRSGPGGGAVPYSIETAGSLQGGAVVWALAHLPDLDFQIGDDAAKTYLLISNAHDASKALQLGGTTYRPICANTLRLAESQMRSNRKRHHLSGGAQIRHTPGMHAALQRMQEVYAAIIRNQVLTREGWQFLASRPLTERLKLDFLASVFGRPGTDESDRARAIREARESRIEAILASPTSQVTGTKDTALSMLHSVVEWVEHDRSSKGSKSASVDENRLYSSSFASGSVLKAKAWASILELAKA